MQGNRAQSQDTGAGCGGSGPRDRFFREPEDSLLLYFTLAAGMAAFTGDFCRVFVGFTMSAAVFLVSHAGACRVSAFLCISHSY